MFKKFSFLMLAAAALLASCSQNEDGLQTGIDGTSQTVTITANTGGSMTTRATNAQGDNEVTRCLIQIFEKTGTEGQELQPMEGYETPQLMEGSETGGFSATVTFNTDYSYTILFWADAGTFEYDATDGLKKVTVAEDAVPGIAYAGSAEWSSTNGTTVGVDLKHAVAKVTLRSTTAVPADRTVTLTGLIEYSTFDLLTKAVTTAKNFTHEVTGEGVAGNIMGFYALVDGETQNLMLNAGGADVEISNVPLAQNKHVILTGDVANAGLATVTFEAKVVEDWDETTTITLIPGNAVKITAANCSNINGDGNYVVSGTFNNPITVTGDSPNIYLKDANINVTTGHAIDIQGGNPTLYVIGGNNSITVDKEQAYGAGIYVASSSSVTITGNGTDDVLQIKGGNASAGIGGYTSSDYDSHPCGNITIENVTVNATSTRPSITGGYAAAIGACGDQKVGSITIRNAVIYAHADGTNECGGAAIGGGAPSGQTDFNITISASTIHVSKRSPYASYIGAGDLHTESVTYKIIPTAKITNSVIYDENGEVITQEGNK